MPLDTRIALGVQPLQVPDPLAQYGQVQNILAAQTQRQTGQLHMQQLQFQMDQAKQAQDAIGQIMGAVQEHGGPSDPMEAAMQMLRHPNPTVQATGKHLMESAQIFRAYQSDKAFSERGQQPPSAAPSATGLPTYNNTTLRAASDSNARRQVALEAPVTAQAPFVETRNLQARGVELPPATSVANNLSVAVAPATTSVANNLVPAVAPTAPVSKVDQIDAEIADLMTPKYMYSPQAKARIEFLTKRRDQLSKAHVVGRNLVTEEGNVTYTADDKVTPSETAKLIAERKALFDKNPKDPNIAVYDQQIKDISLARDTLNFNKEVQQWKVNHPGYSIQQDENGYLVGVDPHTLQGSYVTFGKPAVGGGGKAGKPGTFPSANVQGTPSVLPPAAAVQAAPGVAPAVPTDGMPVSDNRMKGKSTGLTEGQSNAAMFGSAMAQAQQVFNQAEKEGTTTGAGTVNLAQGIVKYVPLGIGDKLVNDIYALAVNDPTKLFGPDINQQKIGQAQLAFSIAYLRKTSGANFGPSEVANTIMEYFPSVGEDKSVVKQKAESRKRAIAGMKISAGSEGKKFIEGYEAPSSGAAGTVASDPLGLFPAKK